MNFQIRTTFEDSFQYNQHLNVMLRLKELFEDIKVNIPQQNVSALISQLGYFQIGEISLQGIDQVVFNKENILFQFYELLELNKKLIHFDNPNCMLTPFQINGSNNWTEKILYPMNELGKELQQRVMRYTNETQQLELFSTVKQLAHHSQKSSPISVGKHCRRQSYM